MRRSSLVALLLLISGASLSLTWHNTLSAAEAEWIWHPDQKTGDVPSGTRFSLGKTGELYRERYWQRSQFEAVAQLKAHFDRKGKSLVQAAVAWVVMQPGVTSAIIGASRVEQLTDSLAAAETTLDAEDVEVCDLAWYSMPRTRKAPR